MAPVKKPPKNAFSFYMDEHIPRLRAEGINIGHKESREKILFTNCPLTRRLSEGTQEFPLYVFFISQERHIRILIWSAFFY